MICQGLQLLTYLSLPATHLFSGLQAGLICTLRTHSNKKEYPPFPEADEKVQRPASFVSKMEKHHHYFLLISDEMSLCCLFSLGCLFSYAFSTLSSVGLRAALPLAPVHPLTHKAVDPRAAWLFPTWLFSHFRGTRNIRPGYMCVLDNVSSLLQEWNLIVKQLASLWSGHVFVLPLLSWRLLNTEISQWLLLYPNTSQLLHAHSLKYTDRFISGTGVQRSRCRWNDFPLLPLK